MGESQKDRKIRLAIELYSVVVPVVPPVCIFTCGSSSFGLLDMHIGFLFGGIWVYTDSFFSLFYASFAVTFVFLYMATSPVEFSFLRFS